MKQVPEDKPFCFWYGSQEPHRPYEPGSGRKLGMDPGKVSVPPFLPDTPEVREDILDYYKEVQDFDRQVAEILEIIEAAGRTANTLVVMTSDNGMPFPRAKANLYDSGTHLPLAICWPGRIAPGKRMDATFSFTDFAPTLLAAAGVKPVDDMTGKSWLPMLIGDANAPRERVYFGRERHANVRAGDLSYPARAVRTKDYLYIRNFRPDRWPAGDPEYYRVVGPFGDIDGSPTKTLLLERRDDPAIKPFFEMACAKRPAEELYDLKKDPWQLNNVADDKAYAETKARLGQGLESHLKRTGDPRVTEDSDAWDRHPYYGEMREWPPGAGNAQGQKRE
jgi:arylsulfatase A-like enzyme